MLKLTVLNIIRRHGIGKDSGRPYDFTTVQYMEPVEQIGTEKFNQEGAGYDVSEMPGTPDLLERMRGSKFPGIFEFETDNKKTPRGFELVLSGIKGS